MAKEKQITENIVSITSSRCGALMSIATRHPAASGMVRVTVDHEKLTIEPAGLDDNGKVLSSHETKNGLRVITASSNWMWLNKGHYPIDEDESSEDKLVVYAEDLI